MIDLTQEGTPTEVREHMNYMLDRVYNLAIKQGWDWYEDKSAGDEEKDVEVSAKKKDAIRGKEKTSQVRAVKRSNFKEKIMKEVDEKIGDTVALIRKKMVHWPSHLDTDRNEDCTKYYKKLSEHSSMWIVNEERLKNINERFEKLETRVKPIEDRLNLLDVRVSESAGCMIRRLRV